MKPRSRTAVLAAATALIGVDCSPRREQSPVADTVFVGRFITLDAAQPRVEALAVAGGRIIAAGTSADVERFTGAGSQRVEVPGVAVPGFADAHVHVTGLGEQLETLDLRSLTKQQVLEKVTAAVRTASPGTWILGQGWDEGFWQPSAFPSSAELDAVSGDHPVVLDRIDGHSTWINSRALALAGISSATPDPEGGRIHRDAANRPTGILVDRAREAITKVIPQPTRADQERQVRAALAQYARWGLTSVHDAGTDLETIAIYKDLLATGELPVRVYAMARGTGPTARHYLESGPEIDLGNGVLTIRSFKILLDGALGSRGAELTDPYADAPAERGLRLMSDDDLDGLIGSARARGFQVNAHVIGDRAVSRALDAFERGGVQAGARFRLEHASVIAPADLPRFARLGVVASMQPVFIGEYSRWSKDRVGAARLPWVLPIRDLLATGAQVAAGTDYPASDSGDPIATLYCLVTRRSAAGEPPGGWQADQRVDVDTALRLMTSAPAFAAFQEKRLGALVAGRDADFTVLSADPYETPIEDLRTLAVRMTVMAGQVRFGARRETTPAGR